MRDERKTIEAEADGLIEGRNAVIEALRAGTAIDKVYIARGETDATLGHIAASARDRGVVVVECDRRKLDGMSRTKSHQGVVAVSAVREYASVEDILAAARDKGEAPLIVVCDELSDPHNLGAVIRTAECAGAHGVVIPNRHCGQNFGRGGELSACSPGGKPDLPAQRAEKGGAVGVWHCRRWKYQPVRRGSERPCCHCHRQ